MLLDVYGRQNELLRRVVDVKWDAAVLLAWLYDNRAILYEDVPPQELEGAGSIAERIQAFYEKVDPDDTNALERVFRYRSSHGLRFALRGVDVPDAYLGRLCGRHYEVSCAEAGAVWSYQCDLPGFLKEIESFTVE